MFGLVSRKELYKRDKYNEAKRHELANTFETLIQAICPHKKVREDIGRGGCGIIPVQGFRCTTCRLFFDKVPKGSKVSRMKEILSDK